MYLLVFGGTLLQCFSGRKGGAFLLGTGSRWQIEGITLLKVETGINGYAPMPDESDDAPGPVPLQGGIIHIVDIVVTEVLEVEYVECRIFAGGIENLLCISDVVIPSGLASSNDFLAPYLISQITV